VDDANGESGSPSRRGANGRDSRSWSHAGAHNADRTSYLATFEASPRKRRRREPIRWSPMTSALTKAMTSSKRNKTDVIFHEDVV